MAARMGKPKHKKTDDSVSVGTQKAQIKITNKLDSLLIAEDKSSGRNWLEPTTKHKAALIGGGILLMSIGVMFVYVISRNRQPEKPTATVEISSHNLRIAEEDKITSIVQEYGAEYDAAVKEVYSSSSSEWNKTKLDKAYFSLLYADKVGSFSEVYAVLSLLESAQKKGVDIDDNSYGLNQRTRDEIRKRADNNAQKVLDHRKGDGNE